MVADIVRVCAIFVTGRRATDREVTTPKSSQGLSETFRLRFLSFPQIGIVQKVFSEKSSAIARMR